MISMGRTMEWRLDGGGGGGKNRLEKAHIWIAGIIIFPNVWGCFVIFSQFFSFYLEGKSLENIQITILLSSQGTSQHTLS